MQNKGKKFLSDLKLHSDYLKWQDDKDRYETWEEACESIIDGHKQQYADKLTELQPYLDSALESMKNKSVLASQRNLQYRYPQIKKENARLYNCVSTHCSRNRVFQEVFFLGLCGCGCGISLLKPFVKHLSKIEKRLIGTKTYVINDSISGWADALGVLLSSYFVDNQPFPEYAGYEIKFDYSQIRERGAKISGGFKAPGSAGLKQSLENIEKLLENWIEKEGNTIRPILAFDILCYSADSVLSGGIRRSALNMLVDPNDEEMIHAKIGNWRAENPQRARSNNSVLLRRKDVTKEEFEKIVHLNNGDSDIGFAFVNSWFDLYNPCFTGDMKILLEDGYHKLEDLEEEILHKFVTPTGNIANGYIKLSGYKSVANIVFNNGKIITCTPDHVFMTVDGEEVEAKDLKGKYLEDLPSLKTLKVIEVNSAGLQLVYDFELDDMIHYGIVEGVAVHNCFEISKLPVLVDTDFSKIEYDEIDEFVSNNFDKFGIQACNLTEINAEKCTTKEKFLKSCKDAAILGTLQAGYTEFPYLGKVSEEIVRREALLGVSVTGWMNNPKLFNPELLKEGANLVKTINKEVAKIIGINPAARTTTTKPSGNASVILGTSSGIHPEHSERYFRIMQLNKETDTAKWLKENMEFLLEESVWSATNSDYVVFVPIENPKEGLYKKDMKGIKHLELIKLVQENWVKEGTDDDLCVYRGISHNVSNTVIIDDKDEMINYIFDNRDIFNAVSFLSDYGDKDFNQAPFTSVLTLEELIANYGTATVFASGLIVDGLHYFDNNLWLACDLLLDIEEKNPIIGTREQVMLRKYWLKRAKKFAKNYFKGDLHKMVYCLKDVHLFHKWDIINRQFREVDFSKILSKPVFKEIGEFGAVACSGGQCEIVSF